MLANKNNMGEIGLGSVTFENSDHRTLLLLISSGIYQKLSEKFFSKRFLHEMIHNINIQ